MRFLATTLPILFGLTVLGCSDSGSSGGAPPATTAAEPTPATPAPSPPDQPPPQPPPAPQPPVTAPTDDLAPLSDAFDDPATLSDWLRLYQTEQWGADQLEAHDLGATRPGWLTLIPYTSTWYQDYRGVLVYKQVQGDFVVTTRVVATNRAGDASPGRPYSLAGIMVRAPRNVTPATWQPGGEDYVFLSLGAADLPGLPQTEVKTTDDSDSTLAIEQAAGQEARIRVARIGDAVLCLIREETTPWRVHRRYARGDLPATLQVGLTVYTDWPNASALTPEQHNQTQITSGQPDLRAQFDFVRYARPQVPAALAGRDLSDPGAVSDPELLAFLGQD